MSTGLVNMQSAQQPSSDYGVPDATMYAAVREAILSRAKLDANPCSADTAGPGRNQLVGSPERKAAKPDDELPPDDDEGFGEVEEYFSPASGSASQPSFPDRRTIEAITAAERIRLQASRIESDLHIAERTINTRGTAEVTSPCTFLATARQDTQIGEAHASTISNGSSKSTGSGPRAISRLGGGERSSPSQPLHTDFGVEDDGSPGNHGVEDTHSTPVPEFSLTIHDIDTLLELGSPFMAKLRERRMFGKRVNTNQDIDSGLPSEDVGDDACEVVGKGEVFLQIYNFAAWTKDAGLPIFHLGVEVYQKEFYYSMGGIDMCKPRGYSWQVHRESFSLGKTSFSQDDVLRIAQKMRHEWVAGDYAFLGRNCQDFAVAFCKALGVHEAIPKECVHFANMSELLPPALVEGIRNADRRFASMQTRLSSWTGPPQQEQKPKMDSGGINKQRRAAPCRIGSVMTHHALSPVTLPDDEPIDFPLETQRSIVHL